MQILLVLTHSHANYHFHRLFPVLLVSFRKPFQLITKLGKYLKRRQLAIQIGNCLRSRYLTLT